MAQEQVRADRVRKGMAVMDVKYAEGKFIFKIRLTRGVWPTVVSCEFRRCGENDEPTYYLVLSDAPKAAYPLRPDDVVVIDNGRSR